MESHTTKRINMPRRTSKEVYDFNNAWAKKFLNRKNPVKLSDLAKKEVPNQYSKEYANIRMQLHKVLKSLEKEGKAKFEGGKWCPVKKC
jgi:hypothetical protein